MVHTRGPKKRTDSARVEEAKETEHLLKQKSIQRKKAEAGYNIGSRSGKTAATAITQQNGTSRAGSSKAAASTATTKTATKPTKAVLPTRKQPARTTSKKRKEPSSPTILEQLEKIKRGRTLANLDLSKVGGADDSSEDDNTPTKKQEKPKDQSPDSQSMPSIVQKKAPSRPIQETPVRFFTQRCSQVPLDDSTIDQEKGKKMNPISDKDMLQYDPQVYIQLSLHKGTTAPKFGRNNILLVNKEHKSDPEEKLGPKEFYFGSIYTPERFEDVLGAIKQAVESNSGYTTCDHGEGVILYHRGYPLKYAYYSDLDQSTHENNPKSITDINEWHQALRVSSLYIGGKDDQVVEQLTINLLVRVASQPKQKPTKGSRPARNSQTTTTQLSQLTGPGDGGEDIIDRVLENTMLKELPFGWNITLKLNIQPYSLSKAGKDEKYQLDSWKQTFSNQERITIYPCYSKEVLLKHLEQNKPVYDLDPSPQISAGSIVKYLKEHIYHQVSSYRDQSTGDTILGEFSPLFIQERLNSKDASRIVSTESFWKIAQRLYNSTANKPHRAKNELVLNVSMGHKVESDQEYQPLYDSRNDYVLTHDLEEGEELVVRPRALDLIDAPKYSQDADKLKAPPAIKESKQQAKVRSDMTKDSRQMEEYIWNLVTTKDSPYYHALSMEHYEYVKVDWLRYRSEQAETVFDQYPCTPGLEDTWPSLDFLPEAVRMGGKPFCNQKPGVGLHPVDDSVMGSYKRYKLSEHEIAEEERAEQREILQQLVGALGGKSNTPSDFAFRFQRADDPTKRFDYVLRQNQDDFTLEDAYDSPGFMILRSGFDKSTYHAVKKGTKEPVISHCNNKDHSIQYLSVPRSTFALHTARDIIATLPKDNNGYLDGAAFPVLLLLSIEDVPDTGGDCI